jgi:hypothetical protein
MDRVEDDDNAPKGEEIDKQSDKQINGCSSRKKKE